MKIQITFRDIPKLAHLEAFVLTKTEGVVNEFIKHDAYRLHVWLDTERHRGGSKKPNFRCEVLLHILGRRNSIVIKKTSDNFYESVSRTEHALKKRLRRDAACQARHYAKNHTDERGPDDVVDNEIAV